MTSEEFQHLRTAFEHLQGASAEERAASIRELAASNANLARELERMLAAYTRSTCFLDRPAAASLPSEPPDFVEPLAGRIGTQIGAYRLEKELGHGGMGVVYEATRADGSFTRRAAIKILRHDRLDASFLNRFHQERRILAQLSHPHIASILDAGVTPQGDPWFVMEYVDGVSLTAYCAALSLSLSQRLDLFLQVCSAVQHAHRNLTVHRDLKPSNILVTEAGAVKLLDFGIAKMIEPDGPHDAAQTAAILTPEYTSPEQIRQGAITTSADIFSLGILLYEMISGAHPFRKPGRLPHEVMRAICEDEPPPPSAVARTNAKALRGELDTIVLTALRKEPAWRYPSVEQLADDVERYQHGWPVLARGNGPAYRLRKFVRRHWLPVTAAAALVTLLIAGILMTTHQARVADAARLAAEQARTQAEKERAIAERQRNLAEQARRFAGEQQKLADTRASEAEHERQREQERYREVRSLASSLLFDLYDGVRDLAGSTTARRLMVSRAQHQLELLRADSGNDIGLQRDLAASWERLGELRVDPARRNKNDAAAAVEACQRALDLRKQIVARRDSAVSDRRDLALSISKLGDGNFFAGDMKTALSLYQDARSLAKSLVISNPADNTMPRALGTVDERLCVVLLTSGKGRDAMDSCQEGIATLSPLAKALPDDVEVQKLIADTEASYANALRLSGKGREAAVQARQALESLERLEALAPSNAEYRRLTSSAESILAASLAASGDEAASLEAFQRSIRSMEIAIEIDPTDLGSPLRLAVTLLAFSRRLEKGTQKEKAHDAAREALRLLEQTSEKPGAGAVEWNEYADALLKVDWPDLKSPEKALPLAEKAVATSNRRNPFFLDTLAWAWYQTGETSKAIETERDALHLLPATAHGGLHDELARGLDTFLGRSTR